MSHPPSTCDGPFVEGESEELFHCNNSATMQTLPHVGQRVPCERHFVVLQLDGESQVSREVKNVATEPSEFMHELPMVCVVYIDSF